MKALLRPLKTAAVPILRPLVDTHVPLPHWLYDQILYHYVTPFSSVIADSEPEVMSR